VARIQLTTDLHAFSMMAQIDARLPSEMQPGGLAYIRVRSRHIRDLLPSETMNGLREFEPSIVESNS
jgi:hypothetical protein